MGQIVTVCADFIWTCYTSSYFLDRIVTGDEYWVVRHDPETKRLNMETRVISEAQNFRPENQE